MASATGSFEIISAGEDPYHDVSGEPKLARAHGTQRFTGDIKGEGSVEWLMCYLPDGTARFVGHQRSGGGGFHALGGPHVSYTLEHDLG